MKACKSRTSPALSPCGPAATPATPQREATSQHLNRIGGYSAAAREAATWSGSGLDGSPHPPATCRGVRELRQGDVRLRVGAARVPVAPQLVCVMAAKPGAIRLEPVAEATLGGCRRAGEQVGRECAKFVAREQPVAQKETGECRAGRDEATRRGEQAGLAADGVSDLGHEVGEGEGLWAGEIEHDIAFGLPEFGRNACQVENGDGLQVAAAAL